MNDIIFSRSIKFITNHKNIKKMRNTILILILVTAYNVLISQDDIFPGADERTPSKSQYFSWINNTNEGPTEEQTLINLEFFKWLHDEYGMVLDIYAFDAGTIDGARFYGSDQSDRFKRQFPTGFGNVVEKAAEMDTRLGLWGGPDGFGDTPEEEEARIEMMVGLCRDYNWALFKMDAVCGQLRPEKYDAFDRMMRECRKYTPDLILLNHRLDLGKGTAHSTTFLLGGAETYIDVHMANEITATHNRAGALDRELPENLTRLTEDHGVCISSCIDYWEDDLILQAFNRNLILAPQIYGNPWLLSDHEFTKLARIFNLHKRYNDIMVDGMVLSERDYGPGAVSRGDDKTRLITLRNLTWEPVKYTITVDQSIGLANEEKAGIIIYHPYEYYLGEYEYGSKVEVEVLPFRSSLVKVSNDPERDGLRVEGCRYEVVRDVPGRPVEIRLLGFPGESADIKIAGDNRKFKTAIIEGESQPKLTNNKYARVTFDGEPFHHLYHRKLLSLNEIEIPADAESIYEATCFAADNNALEVRSLYRSGETKIPEVKAARDAFFNQTRFIDREIWDKYLFDGDPNTAFSVNLRWDTPDMRLNAFRLDLGKPVQLDSLIIRAPDINAIQPLKIDEGIDLMVSDDLKTWKSITSLVDTTVVFDLSDAGAFRYAKISRGMMRMTEVEGYFQGKLVDRSDWRASNLFKHINPWTWPPHKRFYPRKAWDGSFVLNEIPKNSYLAIAINGEHGNEGAYAGLKIDGVYHGCPDRAPSFDSNTWECPVRKVDKNYTYFFPLTPDMKGKEIEVYTLAFNEGNTELSPEVYITAYPIPFEEKLLILKEY